MPRHVLLDNVTHRDLRIRPCHGPGSGHDVNIARAFPSEFRRLQTTFPLFLVRNADTGHFEPIALLGFERGENLYLGEQGWDGTVVPLTLERQPFLIGFQTREVDGVPEQVPMVHVDLDHPAISDSEGERVFLPQGGESPLLERVSSVLMTIHEGQEVLRSLSQLLVGLELVESVELEVAFRDGSKQTLTGLFTVNEEKLAGLSGAALESLHRKGHLADVFMMLASLPNLEALIERKNRRLTG